MKILSLSTVYPNSDEPGLGLFVRARLLRMAQKAELKVIAPIPVLDYSNPKRKVFPGRNVPARRQDGDIEVLHPRWIYPPTGTPLNVICLFLWSLWPVVRLRRRFRFEWIDAHFGYPEGVAAALLSWVFRCPFTITLRGSEPIFARYRYRRLCLRWAFRRAERIFAVSENLRRFAISCGADAECVQTIPNGIEREVFHPRDRSLCRAKFGMAEERRIIACAGELIEAKGHHLVVQAVHDLLQEGYPVDLYIAGGLARGGPRFDRELDDLISRLGVSDNVHRLGWLNRGDLADLLCAADIFCLASFSEGWPNVVNEALACGTPVVATSVGAVPEMLANRQHGIVVPPEDQKALTRALREACGMTWEREAIANWGQSRSWEDVAHEVLETMRALRWHEPRGGSVGLQPTSTKGSQI